MNGITCRAAVMPAAPVLGRLNFFQPLQSSDLLQLFINQMPGAIVFSVDFTLSLAAPAARTVQEALGATGQRANPAGFIQAAIPASKAILSPAPLFQNDPDKMSVQTRVNRQLGKLLGYFLHPGPASQG